VESQVKILHPAAAPGEGDPAHSRFPAGRHRVEDTQRTDWTHFLYIRRVTANVTINNNPLSTPSGLQTGRGMSQPENDRFLSRWITRRTSSRIAPTRRQGRFGPAHTARSCLDPLRASHLPEPWSVFRIGLH
jgi:hypothetical protein